MNLFSCSNLQGHQGELNLSSFLFLEQMNTSQQRLINDGESEAPLLANDYNQREDETYQVTPNSSSRMFDISISFNDH